ncbi:methylthioribose-1-phosphate isomerase [Allopseudospirillum japonicum]|uniref:Methylthioribose-1-phosphate isomerase n=1 Tax=Allopseudospirillum japonicum TaxID=64971 RepID=A0A1H6TFE5_9GAMM|nr:S-methyl-5-thioribose-1-phosphate isomerase [Allopseudospirillum japonicum]SEI74522.1 methylthioribose-1-phosphate isomerase [Allopseudospirillum japonicum]
MTAHDLDTFQAIEWTGESLRLLDQRYLPQKEVYLEYTDAQGLVDAIRNMVVRGAPAIGITAAYGVVLAARQRYAEDIERWPLLLEQDLQALAESRPTAVNLFWALDNMRRALAQTQFGQHPDTFLLPEAQRIHETDLQANKAMGDLGANLISKHQENGRCVMTHCNTGALATGGYGTALGVIRSAWKRGLIDRVYANETRPWWQGARLTAWELMRERIPVSLNVDSAVSHILKTQPISWILVGADRITANGDVANKIGTYNLAVQALHHEVGFMVVAPTSTIDFNLNSGEDIPIEERSGEELTSVLGQPIAPEGVEAYNPVFDVTPAELVDVIVTEKGIVRRPNKEKMARLMSKQGLH